MTTTTGIILGNWTTPVELTDRATRDKPALATNGGVICMAWQGLAQDNIWVSVSKDNGNTWSAQKDYQRELHVMLPVCVLLTENLS